MRNQEEVTELVRSLIDAAYESGYYSGRKEDGEAHHLAAIKERERLRFRVIAALSSIFPLLKKCKSVLNALEFLSDGEFATELQMVIKVIEEGEEKSD